MKTKYRIGTLFRDWIGDELFYQLCAIYPDGCIGDHSFISGLVREDPRVEALLATLRSHGYEPNSFQPSQHDKIFPMEVFRKYDLEDYEQAQYLVPIVDGDFFDSERDNSGQLVLETVRANEPIASSVYSDLLVTDALKQQMEQAGLLHLVFKPTRGKRQRKGPAREAYWELVSDLILPPVSPSMYWANSLGEPFDGDPRNGMLLREAATGPESLIVVPELHYQVEDLRAVEPFDLARMHERDHYVASQLFHRFCAERQLKMMWRPVRIDT